MSWLVLLLLSPVAGQRRPQSRGPRALAVLEVPAKGSPRLVPICIDVDGHFYDAGLYLANPRPMSLERGTVYEAERSGDSVGLFTVGAAEEANGAWIGYGQWHPHNAPSSSTQPAKSTPKPADEYAPPVLRRKDSAPPQAPAQDSETAGQDQAAPPTSAPAPQESKPPAKAQAPSPSPSEEEGPHPLLRRGRATAEQQSEGAESSPPPSFSTRASAQAGAAPAAPKSAETYPAISDARDTGTRSYAFDLRPAERSDYEQKLTAMATEELSKFVAQHPGPRPASSPMQQSPPLRAFDPNWSNQPTFVFSATQASTQPGMDYYITVVAHTDLYGQLRQLFSSVTTTNRLSVSPRLEVVDMVDANGNQRGDLLFRQVWDDRTSYIVYAVGMDKLEQLFQGAETKTR